MIVTAKTDVAIRATVELARHAARPDRATVPWVTIDEVARAVNRSEHYLLTVLKQLRIGGIAASQRGLNGGFRLARPAADITVAEVMRAVDHRLLLIDGVPPEAVEYGSTLPPLVTVWVAARAGMRAVFERTTIAAIVDGQLPDAVLALAADVHAWDPPR